MSNRFSGTAEARPVDFGALGAAMSGMRGGFADTGPVGFSPAPAPKHFHPADPGRNPTAGWDPFDPLGEKAREPAEPAPDLMHEAVQAARAEGFAAGMAEAERLAAARGAEDARALTEMSSLMELMSGFDRDQLATRLRQTVMALVSRVIGESGVDADRLKARIESAVILLADHSEAAQLRLHPADHALVDGHQPARLTLVADETIGRGGFRIETRATSIEDGPANWLAQLNAALDRVAMPGEAC